MLCSRQRNRDFDRALCYAVGKWIRILSERTCAVGKWIGILIERVCSVGKWTGIMILRVML